MFYQLLGVALQIAGFVLFCRLGASLSDRLSARCKWAPLAVAGPLLLAMAVAAFVFHPVITFTVQTVAFCLLGFAGGIVVRARQRFTGE